MKKTDFTLKNDFCFYVTVQPEPRACMRQTQTAVQRLTCVIKKSVINMRAEKIVVFGN